MRGPLRRATIDGGAARDVKPGAMQRLAMGGWQLVARVHQGAVNVDGKQTVFVIHGCDDLTSMYRPVVTEGCEGKMKYTGQAGAWLAKSQEILFGQLRIMAE